MADLEIIRAKKTLSLQDLNKFVSQQEQLLGPLVGMGNDGIKTQLTFDMDIDPPSANAVIAPATVIPPLGSILVCRGVVFVSNNLMDADATRPT